jgi:hypothetical protein
MEGVISVSNSTSTPLISGQVFTGTFENVQHYTEITISIYTERASQSSGFVVEWSHDGITALLQEVVGTIGNTSPTARVYSFKTTIKAAYFRLIYQNGAINQTSFRLQTLYHFDVHATANTIPRMNKIDANGQLLSPSIASVNITTATTTEIAAASTASRHYVLEVNLTFSGAQTMSWLSASNVIIQPMAFAANGQLVVERGPYGYFMRTNSGEALQLTTTAAVNVRGTIVYVTVKEL